MAQKKNAVRSAAFAAPARARPFPAGARVKVHSGAWGAGNLGTVAEGDAGRESARLVLLDGSPDAGPQVFALHSLSAI